MSQFAALPDPGQAQTLDGVAACLRLLKTWAGNPSYETITARVNTRRAPGEQVGKTTVVDCFRTGRRRLDPDLVVAVVEVLHADAGYTNQWRQALRVASGESPGAGAQVRVLGSLPALPPGFIARTAVVENAPLSVLSGMAGAGKTTLALQTAHRLAATQRFDRVLAVNLRGSHADQPPAGPDAVLDGFLRLLGVAGQHLPHGLEARSTAFRNRLAGTRALVLLDDAADISQVRPLLAPGPGSITLIASRRSLDGLPGARQVDVGVLSPSEAREILLAARPPGASLAGPPGASSAGRPGADPITPGAGPAGPPAAADSAVQSGADPAVPSGADTAGPVGADSAAADRIAATCGYLPLALARVVAHMRERPGWTLADHADWLAERRRSGRLDPAVRQALDVSYRNLPAPARDLLRLLAHHPGRSFDAADAAALTGAVADDALRDLAEHHLLLPAGLDRWALHDLVRVYAAARSADEDRRSDRRAALTRLFDHLLSTGADPADLAAAADYAAAEGWPLHATRLRGHQSAK